MTARADITNPSLPLEGVKVRLVGEDGNAFAILGRVIKAIRKAGYSEAVAEQYRTVATEADYDHLLRTTLEWVGSEDIGDE